MMEIDFFQVFFWKRFLGAVPFEHGTRFFKRTKEDKSKKKN